MKRGFTIIELLVVVTVISILVGIMVMTYTTFQNRAFDAQAKSLLSAIRTGAERYYTANNEYPLASDVYGGSIPGTCAAPASYATASSVLGVQASVLGGDITKLSTCGSSVSLTSSTDFSKVYYVTKPSASDTAAYTVTSGSCTFTLPATEAGSLSYILIYYNKQYGSWQIIRSNHGGVSTSDGYWCPFITNVT